MEFFNISNPAYSQIYYSQKLIAVDQDADWNTSNSLPLTLFLNIKPYSKLIFGYILPVVIVTTTLLNLFVFSILTKKSMRASINILLASIALSDTLTGLSALPYYVYFYSRDVDHLYIPYEWCYLQKLTSGLLPTIFHTISVWLTLMLAVQRYIYLCHSLSAKKLCTIRRTTYASIFITITAFIFHSPRLFDSTFIEVTLDIEGVSGHVDTCVETPTQWVIDYQNLYYPIYYWSRVVLIHLLPCVALVVLNIILVHVMRTTNSRRRLLLIQNRHSEWRRMRETNITTFMLSVVVSVFLLVEIPLGVLTLLAMLKTQYGLDLLGDSEITDMISVAFNLVLLLSYPVNFFLYVSMSKKFRTELHKIVCNLETVEDSMGTVQTSREKSSSMDLIKTIFTVIAVPTGTTKSRKPSAVSVASSTGSPGKMRAQRQWSNGVTMEKTNPTCKCPCKHCIERCQKPKNYGNVSVCYTDDLKINDV